jgi:hypothetical protein
MLPNNAAKRSRDATATRKGRLLVAQMAALPVPKIESHASLANTAVTTIQGQGYCIVFDRVNNNGHF